MHTDWLHVAKAFAVAIAVVFFTDWFFFGRPELHPHYQHYAGVWKRFADKKDEVGSIVLGTLVSFAACAVFLVAAGWLGISGFLNALALALCFWIAGPLAHLVSCSIFMNLDRTVALNHALGWLVRFVACAVGIAIFF